MTEIERFQKIQILLAEYNGVRAHIISRTTTSVQIMVLLIGSVAATAVQAKSSFAIGVGVTLFIFISLSVVLFLITTDLLEESRQSVELERRINELSGCEEPPSMA